MSNFDCNYWRYFLLILVSACDIIFLTLRGDNMPNNESIKKSSVVIGAVQLAILYFPAYFLNNVLSYTSKIGLLISMFIVPVFLAVLSFIVVFSNSKVKALSKWLFSIPISFIFLVLLVNINFANRAFNWVYSDYVEPPVGDNPAEFMIFLATSGFILLSIIIGMLMSCKEESKKEEKRIYLYKQICSIICGAILSAVLALSVFMP